MQGNSKNNIVIVKIVNKGIGYNCVEIMVKTITGGLLTLLILAMQKQENIIKKESPGIRFIRSDDAIKTHTHTQNEGVVIKEISFIHRKSVFSKPLALTRTTSSVP